MHSEKIAKRRRCEKGLFFICKEKKIKSKRDVLAFAVCLKEI